jgi:hypothetical protein
MLKTVTVSFFHIYRYFNHTIMRGIRNPKFKLCFFSKSCLAIQYSYSKIGAKAAGTASKIFSQSRSRINVMRLSNTAEDENL